MAGFSQDLDGMFNLELSTNYSCTCCNLMLLQLFIAGVTSLAPGAPPVNFILKIQSFPVLAGTQCQKYESEFESKGYRWYAPKNYLYKSDKTQVSNQMFLIMTCRKLVLYPHGNKSKNVNDHLSLYLGVSSTSSLPLDWEVFAVFKLFLLNQNNDNWVLPKGCRILQSTSIAKTLMF